MPVAVCRGRNSSSRGSISWQSRQDELGRSPEPSSAALSLRAPAHKSSCRQLSPVLGFIQGFPRCFPPTIPVIPVVNPCWKQLQECENVAERSSTHFSSSLGKIFNFCAFTNLHSVLCNQSSLAQFRQREGRSGDFSSQLGLQDCRAQSTPPHLFLYLNPWIPVTIFL